MGAPDSDGKIFIKKDAGKIDEVDKIVNLDDMPGSIGIGHTRWATHGAPLKVNSHPHMDCKGEIAVVHNGIIENFMELKSELENLGHKFGDDEIDEALKNISVTINTDFNEQKVTEKDKRESLVDKEKWTITFQFKDGKWDISQQLYMDLVKEAKKAGIEFEENPTKFYIGWIGAGKNFCQIHGQKSGMKIWVTLRMADLTEQETLKVRDVSQIGHWGMGDIEFSLNNLKDFEWAINIIKKAYSKGLK